ncbi:hypothetical protein [Nonomuraea sp. NPDC050786]|uniref:hypothetical protein n=1 Tax=Nonomuraea sp. NPDC050786 TaxID=3154840 RepID=UPI0033D72FC5
MTKSLVHVCRRPGELDAPAMERAPDHSVTRHATLRQRCAHRDSRVSVRNVARGSVLLTATESAGRELREEVDQPFDVLTRSQIRRGAVMSEQPRADRAADLESAPAGVLHEVGG